MASATAGKEVISKITPGKGKNPATIRLQGALTLDSAETVLRTFRDAVEKHPNIRVEASNITAVDLGFLQLLHAITQAQTAKGGTCEIQLQLEGDMKTLLINTGFGQYLQAVTNTPEKH